MIKIDMDMPKSCAVCRFNSRCDDCECIPNFCAAAPTEDDCHAIIGYFRDGGHEYDPEIGFTPEDRRQDWCPLKEVRHGKWISGAYIQDTEVKRYSAGLMYCSVCKHEAYSDTDYGEQLFDYCPYCGASLMQVRSNYETDYGA